MLVFDEFEGTASTTSYLFELDVEVESESDELQPITLISPKDTAIQINDRPIRNSALS